jgi:hypothetical protein
MQPARRLAGDHLAATAAAVQCGPGKEWQLMKRPVDCLLHAADKAVPTDPVCACAEALFT